jgi:hypothetical protein
MLLSTGRIFVMVMRVNWVIIRSLLCFLTRLFATCTNIMQIHMQHTAFYRFQGIRMCMVFSSFIRLYIYADSERFDTYCT